MQFETYTYWIGPEYLPALINGDDTGLSFDESRNIDGFANSVAAEHGAGHWSPVEGTETFRRCDVSGLWADCTEVNYMARVEAP